jgi:beta-lactamase class A
MLLQACQPGIVQPTQINNTLVFSPSQTETPAATPTSQPIPTEIPTATPAPNLAELLDQSLIAGVDWYVGVETADGERLYARNTEETFFPASLNNIPIAMVVLKILEYRGDTIEDIHTYGIGQNFSTLLERMVVDDDAYATEVLTEFAEGYGRLRNYLNWWGLKDTFFYPRRTTVEDQLLALKQIDSVEVLNEAFSNYLLQLMGTAAENEEKFLGIGLEALPGCTFYNKSGSLSSPMKTPTVISETGILKCDGQSWYIVIAGTPISGSSVFLKDVQSSIEQFGKVFSEYIQGYLSY